MVGLKTVNPSSGEEAASKALMTYLGLGFLHAIACARCIPMTLRGQEGQTQHYPLGAPLSPDRHVGLPRLLWHIHQFRCCSGTHTCVALSCTTTTDHVIPVISLVHISMYINVRFSLLPPSIPR